MKTRRLLLATFSAISAFLLTSGVAYAQATPVPEPKGHPWTTYMSWAALGIAALALIMGLVGYAVQSKGFEKENRKRGPAGTKAS